MKDWKQHWADKHKKIQGELDKGCIYIERVHTMGPDRVAINLPYQLQDFKQFEVDLVGATEAHWRQRTKTWIVPMRSFNTVLQLCSTAVGENKVILKGLRSRMQHKNI